MRKYILITLAVMLTLALIACSVSNPGNAPIPENNDAEVEEITISDSPVALDNSIPEEEAFITEEDILVEEEEDLFNYTVAVEDIIEFGGYEWRVLDLKGGQALILSEIVIEKRAYHSDAKRITWSGCTLRQYLNEDFYNSFTEEEQAQIAETQITTLFNPWYGIPGGDTEDRIFLLSLQELIKYFGDSGKLGDGYQGESFLDDEYSDARIAYDKNGNASMWWLRSVGQYAWDATEVFATGVIDPSGIIIITDEDGGVRPALWLKL